LEVGFAKCRIAFISIDPQKVSMRRRTAGESVVSSLTDHQMMTNGTGAALMAQIQDNERTEHWQRVYQTKAEDEVSWFQARPEISLDLIRATDLPRDAAIIDIGGGESRLVDALLEAGHSDVTVLDLSSAALEVARRRLGAKAGEVKWIVGDATKWSPRTGYDIWHDRAAFHFLTDAADRLAYMERLRSSLRPGGQVIIGTFGPDGPEKCSGLPVMRHDSRSLAAELGPRFRLEETRPHEHLTPGGNLQHFQFSRFRLL
jgi:SAM-dependent methyltransferase